MPFRNTERRTVQTYGKIYVPVVFLIEPGPRDNEYVLFFHKWEEEEERVSNAWTTVVVVSL